MTAEDLANALPTIPELRARCRALARLDAILSPEWESRYYSFVAGWAPGEQMASMRNGSGDEWSIVFTTAGAYLRGFAHESKMSPFASGGEPWPGVLDTVPYEFAECVDEPAFSSDDTPCVTVCVWRGAADDRWHHGDIDYPAGPDPDGSASLFGVLLDPTPASYRAFAEDYYEVEVDAEAAAEIFASAPLTDNLVQRLNPDLHLADLADDVAAIG